MSLSVQAFADLATGASKLNAGMLSKTIGDALDFKTATIIATTFGLQPFSECHPAPSIRSGSIFPRSFSYAADSSNANRIALVASAAA